MAASDTEFEILTCFENLTDPRIERARKHKLCDLIAIALCGMLADCNGWADVERFAVENEWWFDEFLELPSGIASHDTFGRVFARIDPTELEECLLEYVRCLKLNLDGQTVAIDGKTLRGSHDGHDKNRCKNMITAWANELNTVLGVVSTGDKSNEIPAVQQLLQVIELKGAVVTADAMHCQKETAAAIVNREANYILQLKKNQPTLFETIESIFETHTNDQFENRQVRTRMTIESNRGRQETRFCAVCPAPARLKAAWRGLKSIGMMHRVTILANGTERRDLSYFISSLPPKVGIHHPHIRRHWSVENTVHHTMDVTFFQKTAVEFAREMRQRIFRHFVDLRFRFSNRTLPSKTASGANARESDGIQSGSPLYSRVSTRFKMRLPWTITRITTRRTTLTTNLTGTVLAGNHSCRRPGVTLLSITHRNEIR